MSRNVKNFIRLQNEISILEKLSAEKRKHLNKLKTCSVFKLPSAFKTTLLTCKLLFKEITKNELEKLLYLDTPNLIKHVDATLPYTTLMSRLKPDYIFYNDTADNEQVYLLTRKYIFTIDISITPAIDEIPFIMTEKIDEFRYGLPLKAWKDLEKNAQKRFASNKIKRGCRNWMRKPYTKDGLVGIEPRVAYFHASNPTPLNTNKVDTKI